MFKQMHALTNTNQVRENRPSFKTPGEDLHHGGCYRGQDVDDGCHDLSGAFLQALENLGVRIVLRILFFGVISWSLILSTIFVGLSAVDGRL